MQQALATLTTLRNSLNYVLNNTIQAQYGINLYNPASVPEYPLAFSTKKDVQYLVLVGCQKVNSRAAN